MTDTAFTDCQDVRLRRARDLPRASSTLCSRLHHGVSGCLLVRQISRIDLPHHRARRLLRHRLFDSDLHDQRCRSLHRSHPPHFWNIQRAELATILGDDSGARTSSQESCSRGDCKLCQPMFTLVLAAILSNEPGTSLSYGRWTDSFWMFLHGWSVLAGQVVGEQTEQTVGRG